MFHAQRSAMARMVWPLLLVACGATDPAHSDALAAADNGTASTDIQVYSGPCPFPTEPGLHRTACQGHEMVLNIPASCTSKACGLIIDVHGRTMSADIEDANSNLRALGAKHDFVVLQPSANPPAPESSWVPASDDDDVWAAVEALRAQLPIDPKRIHFTGMSQGAWMTWRMLCAHADVLASVAPLAGCTFGGNPGCTFSGSAVPAAEVPILYGHGTLDPLEPYTCALQQRDAVLAAWQMTQTAVVKQDTDYRWLRYESPKGTTMEFVQHDWAASTIFLRGHCFPGSADQLAQLPGQILSYGCQPLNAFHWGEAVVQFFVEHPKSP